MELASRIGSLGGSTSPLTACPNTSGVKKRDRRFCSVRTDRLCIRTVESRNSSIAKLQQQKTESEVRGRYCARLAPAALPLLPSLPHPILSKKLACDDRVSAGSSNKERRSEENKIHKRCCGDEDNTSQVNPAGAFQSKRLHGRRLHTHLSPCFTCCMSAFYDIIAPCYRALVTAR